MAEKSENEASKTGQDVETPETGQDVKRDSLGEPYGDSESGTVSTADAPAGPDQTTGSYLESQDHVPDPTALTGTLETSGTGGGVHERLTGTTRIFGAVEDVARRVESLINERTEALKEEVRGLLLQQEASAKAAQIPQQSVEEHGLPTHQGNIIAPHNDTGAGQDAPRSANVAGSPDDVSDGVTRVEEPAKDSYQQTTIAGAGDPGKPVAAAKKAESEGATEEPREDENKDFKQAADEYEQKLKGAMAGKTTPAKKTTSRRQGNTGGTKK
jgi:hypothetical protein